jgi:single-strand DNA-binding protein
MNKCLFIGNLVKDVEVQTSKAGKAFMNNTLAVSRIDKSTDYLNITAFGKTAEVIGKYFSKGSRIGIEAHAQQSSYEKDGHKVYQITFIVDSIDFCEKKSDSAAQSNSDDDLPFN